LQTKAVLVVCKQQCRTALRDQHQRALNISAIAYNWGFNDLSYFTKSFRVRFDMTPREWRKEPQHVNDAQSV
jgi:AraC-like DNA-binding protein